MDSRMLKDERAQQKQREVRASLSSVFVSDSGRTALVGGDDQRKTGLILCGVDDFKCDPYDSIV